MSSTYSTWNNSLPLPPANGVTLYTLYPSAPPHQSQQQQQLPPQPVFQHQPYGNLFGNPQVVAPAQAQAAPQPSQPPALQLLPPQGQWAQPPAYCCPATHAAAHHNYLRHCGQPLRAKERISAFRKLVQAVLECSEQPQGDPKLFFVPPKVDFTDLAARGVVMLHDNFPSAAAIPNPAAQPLLCRRPGERPLWHPIKLFKRLGGELDGYYLATVLDSTPAAWRTQMKAGYEPGKQSHDGNVTWLVPPGVAEDIFPLVKQWAPVDFTVEAHSRGEEHIRWLSEKVPVLAVLEQLSDQFSNGVV